MNASAHRWAHRCKPVWAGPQSAPGALLRYHQDLHSLYCCAKRCKRSPAFNLKKVAHFSPSLPFLITAAEETLRHSRLHGVRTHCGCRVIVLLLCERHAGGSSSEAAEWGEKKNFPSMIPTLLLFLNFSKSFRTRENFYFADEQQGLVLAVPKWDKFCFLFFAVNSACELWLLSRHLQEAWDK